jgi:hypothetical protein
MTFIEGIAGFEAALKKEKREERPKLDYLILKDGDSAMIQPLQEIDPNSPAYNEEKGLGFLVYVHQSPYNWKRTAMCTMESQGRCLGCELNNKDIDPKTGKPRAWYPRKKFYINVVDLGDKSVKVLSTSGASPILASLIEFYKENGPISQAVFKIARSGASKDDTIYSLTPSFRGEPVDLTEFEPQDARAGGVPEIPYDRQANFYDYRTQQENDLVEATARQSASIWD